MIITCPQCETRYTTDAATFPASGRKVRCSKCGQVWHQAAPEPERVLAPEPAAAGPVTETPAAAPPSFLSMRSAIVPQMRAPAPPPRRSWAERLGLIAGW